MVPEISLQLAQQRGAELRQEAEAYRRAREAAGGRRPRWRFLALRRRSFLRSRAA
ncbi:hypothetical protein GCM10010168_70070 [Actinoplanes ianthinogenes]|uniref:Uncharacterized protein n=1 Tax=Actinoplanes ianthinogenes TaxID=122358 RepID=A0ABN6CJX0_9ACTN|nr:hypothetical protein [Actinoplanes ianthinogenes]BCJ45206.1 hypothetical protein Aiant_58630 [Actinoplanes ianthinogenes]GGR41276.1 hypothetical protein GCM10010168_70070 [Actinoplanes ianthinogenes]